MTPDQKHLVRETWKQVVPTAEAAADLFYRRLFEIDPTTPSCSGRPTCSPSARSCCRHWASPSAAWTIDVLMATVEELGRRHAGYGVTEAHYGSVGSALLWTLEQRLGRAWTPDAASAWSEVYALLSAVMRTAAKDIGPQRVRP